MRLNPSELLIGYCWQIVTDPWQAVGYLRAATAAAVIAGIPPQACSAAELLEEVRRVNRRAPVIFWAPQGNPEEAFYLGSLGASGYLSGELSPARVREALEAAFSSAGATDLKAFAGGLELPPWSGLLVGESRSIKNVMETIRLVGPRRSTVLITGESGTGKEMAARALHLASPRAARPMVTVNCSALPEHLLEAELFGHVKGAFTGAVQNRVGRFEQADGSTLFLDEIGDLPLDLQVKLLRVLQEREFQRLGSSETVRVDIRVIAASNADLVERIRQGRFREDLYYRLNVVPLHMPPLRERAADIPLLVDHFLMKVCRREGLPLKQVRAAALERLIRYDWPGNVRQLENAVEMAVALSGERRMLEAADFPLPSSLPRAPLANEAAPVVALPENGLDYEQVVSAFERNLLEQALRRAGGNKKRAADLLRLKRTTLSAKLRSLQSRMAGAA